MSADDGPSAEECQQITDALTLANIFSPQFSAIREMSTSADTFEIEIQPSYLVAESRVDFMFTSTCRALSDNDEQVGLINASVVAAFDVAESFDLTGCDGALIEWVGANLALFSAYPYIRETIQSLGGRIGLQNMTVDLLRRGEKLPAGLSFTAPGEPVSENND